MIFLRIQRSFKSGFILYFVKKIGRQRDFKGKRGIFIKISIEILDHIKYIDALEAYHCIIIFLNRYTANFK